jgi:hypothetical protein
MILDVLKLAVCFLRRQGGDFEVPGEGTSSVAEITYLRGSLVPLSNFLHR